MGRVARLNCNPHKVLLSLGQKKGNLQSDVTAADLRPFCSIPSCTSHASRAREVAKNLWDLEQRNLSVWVLPLRILNPTFAKLGCFA